MNGLATRLSLSFLSAVGLVHSAWGGELADAEEKRLFFETRIRPLLVESCFECHTEKAKGGLRLDSREALLRGGDSGKAVIVGEPAASLLLEAVDYGADSYQMPPSGRLSDRQIADLRRWVSEGVNWPDHETASVFSQPSRFEMTPEQRQWWAWQLPQSVVIPTPEHQDWVQTPVDAFVLNRMETEGLRPAPPAAPEQLLRRVSFDLTGLPPTPQTRAAFLRNPSRDALARRIEGLLASPRYGERWAQHWFDGVRYVSDVGYYNFSEHGWRYRDWVIGALNADMPYDDFVLHQLAGDLLTSPYGEVPYAEGIIATGVLAMGNYDDQESDKEKLYAEVIDDQIDLVGRQFLGLTLACARCHDHKFDPISTADYYGLGGMFMSSRVLESKSRIGAHRLKVPLLSAEALQGIARLRDSIKALEKRLKQESLTKTETLKLQRRIRRLQARIPPLGGMAIGIREGGPDNSRHSEIGDMAIYIRGNPYRLGPKVPRRIPVLFGGDSVVPEGRSAEQSGRLGLARWIVSPENPLTARVMVNRIWQFHFGSGLVSTPNNFGMRGAPPSHPELLDYLALRLIDSGWSVKAMHRLIMNSAVYQQSTQGGASRVERDPENRWLSRFSPRRLTAEELYDSLLQVGGDLAPGIGEGSGNRAVYRRIGHLHSSPVARLFDAPPTGTIVAQRSTSTTAPQALYLMNDERVIRASQGLADRLGRGSRSDAEQIDRAHLILFGRHARPEELEIGERFLDGVGGGNRWAYFQVLICSNEFVFIE